MRTGKVLKMDSFSKEEIDRRKRAIFDAMGARGQRQILKRGYEKWDPFMEPKEPIDIRRDRTKRTTQMLVRVFLQTRPQTDYSNAYGQGVLEICHGIINDDDRYTGMYEFSVWYRDLLVREGFVSNSSEDPLPEAPVPERASDREGS